MKDPCKECPLRKAGSIGFLKPRHPKNGITLIGDYPTDALRDHFPGREADMLDRATRFIPEKPWNYGAFNLVQCTPPKKEVEDGWSEVFEEGVARCRAHHWPPVSGPVVALGPETLGYLLGGLDLTHKHLGYRYKGGVMGTYHPRQVGAGNTNLLFQLKFDLQAAPNRMKEYDKPKLVLDPTPQEFEKLLSMGGSSPMVVDIETPWSDDEEELSRESLSSNISRVSFCYVRDPLVSVTFPWIPPYMALFTKALAGPQPKVFWNGMFDIPRLELNGCKVGGEHIDAMWLWHFLQPDLPKALACVAPFFCHVPEWKSKSQEDPSYYSAMDSWVEARCFMGIKQSLTSLGMWPIAQKHIVEFLPILEGITKRGIQVDKAQLDSLASTLHGRLQEMDREIALLAPLELWPVKRFKKEPKESKTHDYSTETLPPAKGGGHYFYDWDADGVVSYGCRSPFNPASSQQMLAYLRHKQYRVPRNRKTKRDTTGEKPLRMLASRTHDPLLLALLERRKVGKVFSTYTKWKVDDRGRVRPSFSLNPATGRLSCEKPNFQNIPKEGELAKSVRKCIIAKEGHTLVAADFVGMESYLTGYFAQDQDYMALATKNIYAYVMAKKKGWELAETDSPLLGPQLKHYKGLDAVEYKKFKCIVLGLGYGEGRDTLFANNPGTFESVTEAGELKEFVFKTFPKLKQWQVQITQLAHKEGKLRNPYGYIRWFFDCPGSDTTKALAQLPQSTGAAMVRDDMWEFTYKYKWLGECMILQVHDELVFEVPDARVPEAVSLAREVMGRKRPELGGHSIAVEVKTGKNWAEMKAYA